MRNPWPQIRAALVTLHLIAVVLMALPAPSGGMKRSAWQDPTVQEEIAAWTQMLNGLGFSTSPATLEGWLWEYGKTGMAIRGEILKPLMPYYRFCGTWQSWRMFIAPHRYPTRLHIEIEEGAQWQTIFVANDSEYDWQANRLEDPRMRAALFRYTWKNYRSTWDGLADRLAEWAQRDFPRATRVRFRMYKAKTPSPEQVLNDEIPEGRWIHREIRSLTQGAP